MRKWKEKLYIVHYWTKSNGNESIGFNENEVSSASKARSMACNTRGIRQADITGVEETESIIDLDALGLALDETHLPHGERCICHACLSVLV